MKVRITAEKLMCVVRMEVKGGGGEGRNRRGGRRGGLIKDEVP